jgi:hypothetical protein
VRAPARLAVLAVVALPAAVAQNAAAVGGAASIDVCGQAVWSGAAMPVLQWFKTGGRYDLDGAVAPSTAGFPAVLRFGTGCAHGFRLSYSPRSHVKQVRVARAGDGRVVAVQLRARRTGRFTVTATRGKTKIVVRAAVTE